MSPGEPGSGGTPHRVSVGVSCSVTQRLLILTGLGFFVCEVGRVGRSISEEQVFTELPHVDGGNRTWPPAGAELSAAELPP